MEYCCNANDANKERKNVVLKFKREELLYDVSNYSFVVSDVMPEDEEHAKHQIADIVQDGNVDRVTRVLDLAHAEIVEKLYPYTKKDVTCGSEIDDVLTETKEYVIQLSVPSDFSLTTIKMLEFLIHEYLVCRVLSDWMSITNPAKADTWAFKAENVESQIQVALHSRMGRYRRRLSVF